MIITCMVFVNMHVHAHKLPLQYKLLIEEAYHLSKTIGNLAFNGYHDAPFTTLLITDSAEFLILHPFPGAEFENTGDSLFSHPIYTRPVRLNKHLLATFPAVNGINCIVTGTPENTGKSPAAWVITLLHEHFHQYQQADPSYYRAAASLDLSNGDQTGMWMLNYPFPYDSTIVQNAYADYSAALHAALIHPGKRYNKYYRKFLSKRNNLRKVLPERHYKYFSFQIWQEGIARYAEYALLRKIAENDILLKGSQFGNDYLELLNDIHKTELNNLTKLSLQKEKRIHFYSAGFAEGLLLDKVNPLWHQLYKQRLFTLDHLYTREFRKMK